MLAKKENRVYKISEEQKKDYQKRGFDIIDDDGNIIEPSFDKKILYTEHMKKVKELEEELKKEKEVPKSSKELKGRVEELTKDLELANNRIKELEEEIGKYKPTSSLELDDETEENGDENGQIQE